MTRDNVTYLRPVRSEFRDYPDPPEGDPSESDDALGWAMLFAVALGGFVVGVLAVCVPATIVAVVKFGAWPW